MSNNSKNYASTFIDSMAIIANATTSNLAFDKTIECEVTNADKRDENRYIVKSDNAQFEAFSTADKTYYVHDIVYVTVPGGDFSKQKFIVGRKTDDNDASTVYNLKFPFDDFVKLKKVDMNFSNQPWGFWANKEEDERMPKNQANKIIPRSAILLAESVLEAPVTGLTSLGIQVDVSCFLAAYYPRMGTYGLQIDVMGTIRPSEEHEAFDTERSYTFLNSDMYGNSYAYYQGYQQQKVLDLSTFQSISAIRVYFIQEYNFFDDANIYIPVSDNANIFFENLEIYLGLTNSQLDDEQLFLYTYDSLYFKTINEEEQRPEFLEYNEKVINFQWIHIKDDKTGTILFNKPQDIEDFNNALWEEICGDAVIEDTEAPERIAYNNRELHVYWYEEDLSMSADGTELSEALGKSYGGPRWRQLTFDQALAEGDNAFAYKYYPPLVIQTNEYGQEIESLEDAKKRTPEYFTGFELKTDVGCALTKRRFKTAVVFGNNKYFSSILTFQNFDTIDSGHSQGITDNADMILKSFIGYYDEAGDYYIEEDKSGIVGRFYVYDENDNVLMDTFGRKYSDINYYVQVWRKNPDGSASYIPLFGNELDFTVTWNFQREYTMIENYIGNDAPYSLSIEDIKAFAFLQVLDGIDTLPDNPHTDFDSCHEDIQILLKTTQKFRIKGILVDQWRRNDITAIVSEEHINYYAHKNFQFGQMGSQGSSYTAAIVIEESEAMDAQGDVLGTYADAYILNNSNFKLRCDVYDLDNKLITGIEGYTFIWELLNPEQCKISSSREDGQMAIGPYFYGHYNAGASTQAPAFKVTIKGVCEWDLIAKRGFLTAPLLRQYNIFVPDRIEYKSDGTIPYYYQNFFTIEKLDKENNKIKKILLYPTWRLTGPTRIQLIEKKVPEAKVELGYQQETVVSEHKEYALLVGKENESHSWSAHFDTETIHLSTSIDGAPVRQAIVQDQNVYASSLVNTWDGVTLTLDSSTGSILANRIAAGTKSNNKFTGVMMGDWNPYGDRSIDITGIYGFQDGQQSFGFLKDGTGFIGTAGSGQIKFDGRTAMISSSILNENNQPRCYINLNPATIEFEKNENGSIKLTDGKPTISSVVNESTNTSSSQYFLYCEIPRTNEAQDELQKSWINTFKKTIDSNYDYFIVDPNRGVMTTGGIIGKYGYIGDWLIDRGGLSWYSSAQNNPKGENGNYLNPLLTKEKFYDTIYLGNQKRNPYTNVIKDNAAHKYGSENYEYLISAGKLNEDTFTGTNTGDMNFGVTADGHLFSKSGLIGGWHITDKALYSGERRESVSDNEYFNTHAILLDAENKVISFNNRNIIIDGINATQQFKKNDNGTYAILIDGTNGLIKLLDNSIVLNGIKGTISLANDVIFLDGVKGTISLANNVIFLDGINGIASFGKYVNTEEQATLEGTVYIAGYKITGLINYTDTLNVDTQDSYQTLTGGTGDVVIENATIQVASLNNGSALNIANLNSWRVLDIFNDNTGYGITVDTALTPENKKVTLFCPEASNIALLGTSTKYWDYGYIKNNLYLCYKSTWYPAANQMWVSEQLAEVWSKIKKMQSSINSLSGELKDTIKKVDGIAKAAISNITISAGADGITRVLTYTTTSVDGTKDRNDSIGTFATNKHYHGGTLKIENNGAISLELSKPTVDGSCTCSPLPKLSSVAINSNGGTFTVSVTYLGNTVTSNSFNIASLTWYKERIKEAQEEGYKAALSHNSCDGTTVTLATGTYANQSVDKWKYKASTYTAESHSHTYKPSSHTKNANGTCSYTASSDSHSYKKSTYSASSFTRS